MPFELLYTPEAFEQYESLETNPSKEGTFKQVKKALEYLSINPKHKSLQTHKHYLKSLECGIEVFEAYAQNNTPGAYRIFFSYFGKSKITIISITPHP